MSDFGIKFIFPHYQAIVWCCSFSVLTNTEKQQEQETSASPNFILAIPELSLWDKGCLQTGSCHIRKGMTWTVSTYPPRAVLL